MGSLSESISAPNNHLTNIVIMNIVIREKKYRSLMVKKETVTRTVHIKKGHQKKQREELLCKMALREQESVWGQNKY